MDSTALEEKINRLNNVIFVKQQWFYTQGNIYMITAFSIVFVER